LFALTLPTHQPRYPALQASNDRRAVATRRRCRAARRDRSPFDARVREADEPVPLVGGLLAETDTLRTPIPG
jgi:hypothetical protein